MVGTCFVPMQDSLEKLVVRGGDKKGKPEFVSCINYQESCDSDTV